MRSFTLFFSLLACLSVSPFAKADLNSMRMRIPQIAELKDKGAIGEQADGLLGVREADATAAGVVAAENQDRMEEYKKRADAQGQKVETLMKVLGEARVRQEKEGRYVKSEGGVWTKK